MKKTNTLLLVLAGFFTASCALAVLPWQVSAQEAEKPAPLELDGTTWAIEKTMIDKSGKEGSKSSDTLKFEKKQFYSETYRKKGYEPTNYSSSVSGDGSTTFGTMQNKEDETVYWEGRIKDEKINGSIYVFSKTSKGSSIKEEAYFNGELTGGTLKRKVMPKAEEVEPVKQPEPAKSIE